MEGEEIIHKLEETTKKPTLKSNKLFLRLLKYIGKIDSGIHYEEYVHVNIKVPLIEWSIQTFLLRAFLIYISLSAIGVFLITPPPTWKVLILSEGLSLSWYLLV